MSSQQPLHEAADPASEQEGCQFLPIRSVSCVPKQAADLYAVEAASQGRLVSMEPGRLIIGDPCAAARRKAIDGVKGAQQLIGAPQLFKHLHFKQY